MVVFDDVVYRGPFPEQSCLVSLERFHLPNLLEGSIGEQLAKG